MKVMTILVPTDFSKPAKIAALYAVRIAKKLKANVILLAVITPQSAQETLLKKKKLEEEIEKYTQEDGQHLVQEIKREIGGKVDISFRHVVGYPVEEMVETSAIENGADLIVMGTKGATGLKKVVLGSNAVAVIDNSSRPVIAVPGQTEFTQVKKIVYATDMTHLKDEIRLIALFARFFNASIKVFHVIGGASAKKIVIKKTKDDLIKWSRYPKISFHVSRSAWVAEEVDSFVHDHKADLLTMFTHKLDFYEKLFGKSITRQLAFHAQVPLLTFNKTTLL